MLASGATQSDSANKRLACDRCRGQKLKCRREEDSTVCQRCIAAKAQCIFGSPIPPGRPPTVRLAGEDSAQQQHPPQEQRHQEPLGAQSQGYEQHTAGRAVDAQQSPTGGARSRPATLHTSPVLDSITVSQKSRQIQVLNHDVNADSAPLYDHFNESDIGLIDFANTPLTPATSTLYGNDGSTSWDGSMNTHTHPPFSAACDVTLQPWETLGVGESLTSVGHGHLSSTASSSAAVTPPQQTLMPRSQSAEQLLEFAVELHRLQTKCSLEGPTMSSLTAPQVFPSELAGLIMKLASSFLHLLDSLSMEQTPPPDPTTASHMDTFMSMSSAAALPPLRSTSNATVRKPSSSGLASPTSSSFLSVNKSSFIDDRSIALQLLACYLGLLQLYLVLYTTILEHLQWSDSEARTRQPIWTGLGIGSAALAAFPELQMRMVVQALAEILSRIETRLGLMEHSSRTSVMRTSDAVPGVLGAMKVSPQLIRVCLEESAAGHATGHNTVAELAILSDRLNALLNSTERR